MSKPFPTPYSELNRVLLDVVESVQAVLSNNFVGAYLQGPFIVETKRRRCTQRPAEMMHQVREELKNIGEDLPS